MYGSFVVEASQSGDKKKNSSAAANAAGEPDRAQRAGFFQAPIPNVKPVMRSALSASCVALCRSMPPALSRSHLHLCTLSTDSARRGGASAADVVSAAELLRRCVMVDAPTDHHSASPVSAWLLLKSCLTPSSHRILLPGATDGVGLPHPPLQDVWGQYSAGRSIG